MKNTSSQRTYFKEVRLRQLRALLELSRHRSFAGTAAALGLATPSVWQQIRALETEFGVALVDVRGQQVELTEEGRQLVDLSAPIVEGFESLKAVFLDRQKRLVRQLTLATTASLVAHELREPLKTYRQAHPEVRLMIIDQPSAAARNTFVKGKADVALIGELAGAVHDLKFEATPLMTYPFMLICTQNHPLLAQRRITLANLARHPLVLPGEGTNSRVRVEDVFQQAGLAAQLNVAMTASSMPLLANYVGMGFGISIASVSPTILREARAGKTDYAGLEFRDLTQLFGEEQVILLSRRGRLELPHVKAFREILLAAHRASTLPKNKSTALETRPSALRPA